MRLFGLGKYRFIILAVTMFLVFDLGVLALNFIISSRIAADAQAVNMAGRQRMLSQRAAKALWQIEERVVAGQSASSELQELADATSLFHETLLAFRYGGRIYDGGGQPVALARVDDTGGLLVLQRANAIWEPYRGRILTLLMNPAPTIEDLRPVLAMSRSANLELLALMNELTTHVEVTAAAKATTLRSVQFGGITLATLNFVLILFHFVRKLRHGDLQLERAKKETDDILETVNDGLFLLDRELRIGFQHSAALEKILGRSALAGESFIDVLRGLVSEHTVDLSRDYLNLLLGERVNEKLVGTLNPLAVVETHVDDQFGGSVRKYLEFRFNRVRAGGVVAYLLVTANDVTRRVQLERALKDAQERAKGQMDLLVELLQADPDVLHDFLAAATHGLEKVNTLLRDQAASSAERRDGVVAINRLLRGVKSDAAGAGLSRLVNAILEIEELLVGLREKRTAIDSDDLLPVATCVDGLFAQLDALRGVVSRFAQIRGVVSVEPGRPAREDAADRAPQVRRWRELAQRLAEKHSKQVQLQYHGIDPDRLASPYRENLPTMVSQFIRNAIVHGIERPAERLARGKSAAGNLVLYLAQRDDGSVDLSFRDDGGGLQLAAIRQAAVDRGLLGEGDAAVCDGPRLMELIFAPAFSTRDTPDEDGGQGGGLDAVRAQVGEWGGSIRVGSTPHEYCHFRINLPRPPLQATMGGASRITGEAA